MVTALLVVLFAGAVVLAGYLAYSAGSEVSSRTHYAAYCDGFENGSQSKQMDVEDLEDRISEFVTLNRACTERSDQLLKENKSLAFSNVLHSTANQVLKQHLKNTRQRLQEGCAIIEALSLGVEKLLADKAADAEQIDGLTVDLAMAEAERDRTKAAINELLEKYTFGSKTDTALQNLVGAK